MNYSNVSKEEWANSQDTQSLHTTLTELVQQTNAALVNATRDGTIERVRLLRGALDAYMRALAEMKARMRRGKDEEE
jgi:hypothetical protein